MNYNKQLSDMEEGNFDIEMGMGMVHNLPPIKKPKSNIASMVRMPKENISLGKRPIIDEVTGMPYPHPNEPGRFFVKKGEEPLNPLRKKVTEGDYDFYDKDFYGGKKKKRTMRNKNKRAGSEKRKTLKKLKKRRNSKK
jgi:hypothetical protein